jgi:hypothetical protein
VAHNKLYRNFIILQEDERGYSHSNDKVLSGYAKVEAKGDKCKISFYAQNLKQEDNYSMILICCKRDLKQLIDLGPLAINGVGKGDTSKEYYVNNIAGLGISYEKISGAAICKVNDKEQEFIMHGFMNGEDSTDNWRKYKLVKVDSKKYISKVDMEPKRKDISSADMIEKSLISKENDLKTKTEERPKTEIISTERKKDESNLKPKENIALESFDNGNLNLEDKKQNRIPEDHKSIDESINDLEDRNKCKGDKHHECEESHKHDKCEKAECIEDAINKLGKNLDAYHGVMDIKINNIHEDMTIYGFIKDKSDCDCKWKKFKVETKCRNESQDLNNIEPSARRIEENFKLDNLNTENRLDRLDILDFDEYENKIQKAAPTGEMGPIVPMGQKGETGEMGPTGPMGQKGETGEMGPTGPMGQKGETGEMGPIGPMGAKGEKGEVGSTGPMGQKGEMGPKGEKGEMGPIGPMNTQCKCETQTSNINMGPITFPTMEQPEVVKKVEKCNFGDMKQQPAPMQNFNITGEVGLYFEKIAEDFQPYNGNLEDINYCKLYKINVNNMEELEDESDYNKYTLAYYPMLNYYPYISKEGHFLLGYKCNRDGEMKYIVYAIPGEKEKSCQPYGGRTGFVTWTTDNKSGKGYWLMFYDFKNSSIVIPTK